MEAFWRATIQEMLENMTPEEVVNSLQSRYPDRPELMSMVQQLSPSRADTSTTILGFCKKAQVGSGFGYGNEGQTNFSVPNSEGNPGGGNSVDPTNNATPSSSYTDHIKTRTKIRREEEEEQKRRKKRKQLLEKIRKGQAEPGGLLKKLKNRSTAVPTSTPVPTPGAAEQWDDVEQEMVDTSKQTKDTTQKSETFKRTTKDVTDQLKTQKDELEETSKETEDLADTTDKATNSADKLRKSLEDLAS